MGQSISYPPYPLHLDKKGPQNLLILLKVWITISWKITFKDKINNIYNKLVLNKNTNSLLSHSINVCYGNMLLEKLLICIYMHCDYCILFDGTVLKKVSFKKKKKKSTIILKNYIQTYKQIIFLRKLHKCSKYVLYH